MFCRTCGKQLVDEAVACTGCGVAPRNGNRFCQNCGAETNAGVVTCVKCGVALAAGAPPIDPTAKSKLAAGLLGIFLGGFGVHRFYLGYTGIGIAQIAVTIVTCGVGALWGFIEGILILTGSMAADAQGKPLRD